MIISPSSSYLFFHWRCFNVSLFRQCSVIVLRCSIPRCFHRPGSVLLFRWCSIIPALFRRSAGVPVFRCSVFRCCSVVQQVFRVPVFRWCSAVPRVFRVPEFLVLQYAHQELASQFTVSCRRYFNMTYFYNKSYKRVAASNFLDSSSDEEEENRRTSSVQTKMSLFDSSATLPLCLLPLLQQHQPYTVHRRHHKLGSSP